MIVFRVRLSVSNARRREVVRSLRRTLGPTRALPGCVSCQLCIDVEDDTLVMIQEWSDRASLRACLRADSFRIVLAALDLAREPPQIRFDTITSTRDIGFIGLCRNGGNSG